MLFLCVRFILPGRETRSKQTAAVTPFQRHEAAVLTFSCSREDSTAAAIPGTRPPSVGVPSRVAAEQAATGTACDGTSDANNVAAVDQRNCLRRGKKEISTRSKKT